MYTSTGSQWSAKWRSKGLQKERCSFNLIAKRTVNSNAALKRNYKKGEDVSARERMKRFLKVFNTFVLSQMVSRVSLSLFFLCFTEAIKDHANHFVKCTCGATMFKINDELTTRSSKADTCLGKMSRYVLAPHFSDGTKLVITCFVRHARSLPPGGRLNLTHKNVDMNRSTLNPLL